VVPETAFFEIARVVRSGEWTTYGDISAAVRGDVRWARAVGRAAATLDEFPNAHRVLRSNGTIAPGSPPARDVMRLRRMLAAEGIRFTGGRADPAQRVHWDELRARAAADVGRLRRSGG
jgi:alkylated DNA nucleotide flippase Atl1